MILTVVFFVFLIGVLVLVHEFGHFFAAKKFGVRVDEFAFGFPPRLWSIVKGGTRYAFNLLPLGGYVKIFGESGEGEGTHESFAARPVWQRLVIVGAGVFMNILLAWVLFSAGAALGYPTAVTAENVSRVENPQVGIIAVSPHTPASDADIRFGDIITEIQADDGAVIVHEISEMQDFIARHAGQEVVLVVERGKEHLEKSITPRSSVPEGEGPLGVALSEIGIIRTPWYAVPWEGARMLFFSLLGILLGFWDMLTDLFWSGRISADVSGPIGIFMFARQFTDLGITYLVQLAAVLSVNLAVLNALPFPALDGGRILFLAIEKIKGSKVNQKTEHLVHTVGFAILMLLMLAVTYRDVVRIF